MRIVKESVDRFFDYDLHVESRTIFIGDSVPDKEHDGEIDSDVCQRVVKAFHILMAAAPDKPINVILNSFGGCWFNGMGIYDTIKACPCHVTVTVVGSAMSMGSIILQAADSRLIYPNATIMVHDGYETRVGDIPQTFVNWADFSKKMRSVMYRIYSERSGRKPSFWRQKCRADLILTAKEAKDLGLVDAIVGEPE